jgi:hypothetical protein
MKTTDCDYTRPGVEPWWNCCAQGNEPAPNHAHRA